MRSLFMSALAFASLAAAGSAEAKTLCTLVSDAATGRVLLEEGDCRTRVTPASTFKVPLAVMGFDSGFLKDAHTPTLPYKAGDVDWGGAAWRQPTDPTRWLKYSVVWYSQRITHALGAKALAEAAQRFGYGNADFSGDPGRDNGLDRAWIASSLKVSPQEQVAFLGKLVTGRLPASDHAMSETGKIVESVAAGDGWVVHGKTGTAYPRTPDGGFNRARAYGWYVGWAEKGGRVVVFARLTQDEEVDKVPAGPRVRADLVKAWAALAAALPE